MIQQNIEHLDLSKIKIQSLKANIKLRLKNLRTTGFFRRDTEFGEQ